MLGLIAVNHVAICFANICRQKCYLIDVVKGIKEALKGGHSRF